ncbi:MAG: hypothetical protein NTY19_27710 [Planctomycetota bacterium]|nr:hypothetical protein [Planctomycetota bacterium]
MSTNERQGEAAGLELDYNRKPRNGKWTVTARLNGDAIYVDDVALTKKADRTRFVSELCEGHAGIDALAAGTVLVGFAAQVGDAPEILADLPNAPTVAELLDKTPADIKAEASRMLDDPYLLRHVVDDIGALGVAGEQELVGTVYLVGVSRLLPTPAAAIVQGHTSSGKSYIVERVARLFPPEAVLMATQLTPQALFYLQPGSLRHKFVIAGERSRLENDDTAEATRALREMLSSGRLSKLLPIKEGGRMQTELVEQEGPIAYVETTTLTTIFEEDLNRCLLLGTDDRREQTRRVVARLAEQFSGQAMGGDSERIRGKHHAAQRMLEQRPVVVPFAQRLGDLFASDRVEARRAFPRLVAVIQSMALLHQRQRQLDAAGNIVATVDDYQVARRLLAKPFARQLGGGLSDSALRFAERLNDLPSSGEFTTADAHGVVKSEFTDRAVRGWLVELAGAGVVEQTEPHKGCKPARWKLTGAKPDEAATGRGIMPDMEELFPDSTFRHSDNG